MPFTLVFGCWIPGDAAGSVLTFPDLWDAANEWGGNSSSDGVFLSGTIAPWASVWEFLRRAARGLKPGALFDRTLFSCPSGCAITPWRFPGQAGGNRLSHLGFHQPRSERFKCWNWLEKEEL